MASSDVIELGSSDDEAEPVPKKKKPTLNAMVRFPNEVPGLVIKPVKPILPNLQKVLAGGAVTITNVKKNKVVPQSNKIKCNGRPGQKIVQKPSLKIPIIKNVSIRSPTSINNLSVNPLSLMLKQQNSRVLGPKLSLPPGITVKRTAAGQNTLPNALINRTKQNFKRKRPQKIITTVELDDEEVPTSGTGPQWYLRPEEQTCQPVENKDIEETNDEQLNDIETSITMELENNTEPELRNYIEITIDDSPIKSLKTNKGFEVGTELPITIDDSPIKHVKSVKEPCISDGDVEKSTTTEPQSKKRLNYPKGGEDSSSTGTQKTVEIDVEMPSVNEIKENTMDNSGADVVDGTKMDIDVPEVDTPRRVQTMLLTKEVKYEETKQTNTVQKDEGKKQTNTVQKNDGEFHPIYQKFIELCFELENSDDMTKIVEKKIKTYYRQCPKEYVESEEFTDIVSSKILAMKAAPDKMYLFIKDIVDELNMLRKSAKAVEISNKENEKADPDKYFNVQDTEYDSKRQRQIRKLDRTIKKLHRAIQKLEEQEVEFDDEEDSVYLLTERYKERLIRVHAKFCQLTNTKMPSEPRIQIEARPGLPAGPAKRLEKWVNKKVPIGAPLPFPDFHDVLRCVRDANEEDRLGWNEADIMVEARDLFTRCGKKLQRRRQENEWRIAAARLSHDASALDPAEKSEVLKGKLEENRTLAAKRETELLNKYADKQNQLKLVGEEIGDKEADESPVESEDDEGNDESNSLEDKQKRKERLKRLLHEKTMKISLEKENVSTSAKNNEQENNVVREEQMECDVSEDTENKKDASQEVLNEAVERNDVVNNNTSPINISEDEPSEKQKQEKKNDSDLYDVDSDIDELHLLQKLYSENEINSSTQESDSDTPIAISDTLESDSDDENVKVKQNDDIISIENSSLSESEVTKDHCENARTSGVVNDKTIDTMLLRNAEVLMLSSTSMDDVDVNEENILLASSGEENEVDTLLHSKRNKVNRYASDNCQESSMENNIESYEIPLSDEVKETGEEITSNDTESRILEKNQDDFEFNEVNQQNNEQIEKIIDDDESRNSIVFIEKNQDAFETNLCNRDHIAVKVSEVEANLPNNDVVFENEKNNGKIDNCNLQDDNKNNLSNDGNCLDKVELKRNETLICEKHSADITNESSKNPHAIDDTKKSSLENI